MKHYISYFIILLGAIVAMYGNSQEPQNTVALIVGIMLLMFGVYRISRTIPSKYDRELKEDNIDEEE